MARGNKRFEVVMSGMAWELRSGYVVKSNNITGGPIHLFSTPKMETFRGHARKFEAIFSAISIPLRRLDFEDEIILSAISPRSTDSGFIAEDSKCLAHNSDLWSTLCYTTLLGSLRVERGLEAYYEMSSILVLGIV
ncbi:hypothetical protein L6452_33628 [Arctium lappa]|uniref:Uncharacterized protein n=1 Tax=Arctium lappa TaxID=4217 RepID=A0ACB8YH62_ARCLA|nr:hypothetical protein L6452_33628 [Arctium lappa]